MDLFPRLQVIAAHFGGYSMWDPVTELEHFLSLKLTPEQQEQIAWKAASRNLKL